MGGTIKNLEGNNSEGQNKILWTRRGGSVHEPALEIVELKSDLSGRVGLMTPGWFRWLSIHASIGNHAIGQMIADHLIKSLGCVNKKSLECNKPIIVILIVAPVDLFYRACSSWGTSAAFDMWRFPITIADDCINKGELIGAIHLHTLPLPAMNECIQRN